MSGSGLSQFIALDKIGEVLATQEARSQTAKADVLALLLLKRVARYLVEHQKAAMNYSYQDDP